MTENRNRPPTVVRTERGLSIAGTRITLYAIMDYVVAHFSREYIRDIYRLTDEQIDEALRYIAEHRTEFEEEYRQVVADAEEERRYWEERNRERFAEIAKLPRKPEHAALRAKIAERRAKREEWEAAARESTRGLPAVVRTGRGLEIAGTRITLYSIMGYLKLGWPPRFIGGLYELTDQQIADVMQYIAEHRAEVEAEYQDVLADAEAERRSWEERNRGRFAEIGKLPPKPEHAALRAKIAASKAEREASS